MSPDSNTTVSTSLPRDALSDYRETIFLRFAVITIAVLAPFVVYALIQGLWIMGLSGSLILAALVTDAWHVYRKTKPPIPLIAVFVPIILTVAVSIPERGYVAILWAYPATVMAYFILERRSANVVSAILLITVLPVAYKWLGGEIALRLLVTLALTVTFANIFSTAILRIQQQLHLLASIDPLTGACNRRYLKKRIDELIALYRDESMTASMLLVDIDHFKAINDEFGHDVGDKVLQQLVICMRDNLRNGDDIFRLGGEEFVVLLPAAGQEIAAGIAETIRSAVSEGHFLEGKTITISIGASERLPQEDEMNWLKRCDEELYRAKEQGRNRVAMSTL